MIPTVYICKEFDGVDHLCDFQLNDLTENRDAGEPVSQTFKVGPHSLHFDPDIHYWPKSIGHLKINP